VEKKKCDPSKIIPAEKKIVVGVATTRDCGAGSPAQGGAAHSMFNVVRDCGLALGSVILMDGWMAGGCQHLRLKAECGHGGRHAQVRLAFGTPN